MKITHVLTAVNDSIKYKKFIPIFIETWNKIYPSIQVVIIFVGDSLPEEYKEYHSNLILYKNISEIHSAYVAQTIRILYPSLIKTDGGVLISDIDMIPGRSEYFTLNISNIDNDKFITYRGGTNEQIYMCYNIATPATWSQIFNIHNLLDVDYFLQTNYNKKYSGIHGGEGWSTDQVLLYQNVHQWCDFKLRFVCLNDRQTGFSRLDWFHHHYDTKKFLLMFFNYSIADCHLYADMCSWSPEITNLLSKHIKDVKL